MIDSLPRRLHTFWIKGSVFALVYGAFHFWLSNEWHGWSVFFAALTFGLFTALIDPFKRNPFNPKEESEEAST